MYSITKILLFVFGVCNSVSYSTGALKSSLDRSPPPPQFQKYEALLNATCGRVVSSSPTFPPGDASNFMNAYTRFNGTGSEETVIEFAKQLLNASAIQQFLSLQIQSLILIL